VPLFLAKATAPQNVCARPWKHTEVGQRGTEAVQAYGYREQIKHSCDSVLAIDDSAFAIEDNSNVFEERESDSVKSACVIL